jgi:hypothetical protein
MTQVTVVDFAATEHEKREKLAKLLPAYQNVFPAMTADRFTFCGAVDWIENNLTKWLYAANGEPIAFQACEQFFSRDGQFIGTPNIFREPTAAKFGVLDTVGKSSRRIASYFAEGLAPTITWAPQFRATYPALRAFHRPSIRLKCPTDMRSLGPTCKRRLRQRAETRTPAAESARGQLERKHLQRDLGLLDSTRAPWNETCDSHPYRGGEDYPPCVAFIYARVVISFVAPGFSDFPSFLGARLVPSRDRPPPMAASDRSSSLTTAEQTWRTPLVGPYRRPVPK